jgi:hypothetical protein
MLYDFEWVRQIAECLFLHGENEQISYVIYPTAKK